MDERSAGLENPPASFSWEACMNRQQRRKAGMKDARQPVFQMTQEDIERIRRKSYDKAYADAADTAVALLLSMPI